SAAPLEADLGGQPDLVATTPALQRLADDLLGSSLAVRRRRVDQRDAAVERRADGADRPLLVGAAPHPAADRPRSQADARRFLCDALDLDVLHGLPRSPSWLAARPDRPGARR